MPDDMQTRVQALREYADGFRDADESRPSPIDLKIEHTVRVLDTAARLCEAEGLDGRMAGLVRLAALYHDLGRFEQYHRYRTFSDARSVNHAHLSATCLRRSGWLDGMVKRDRAVVLCAVQLHNRKDIPPGLDREAQAVVRAVRDADKLDICEVMLEAFEAGDEEGVVTLHLEDAPDRVTPAIVAQLRKGRMADYRLMRYVNDFKLLLLSWVYDLNYGWSLQSYEHRGIARRLFAMLPSDLVIREDWERAVAGVHGERRK